MNESSTKRPARRPRVEEQKPVAIAKALKVFAETGDVQESAVAAGVHASTIRRLLARDPECLKKSWRGGHWKHRHWRRSGRLRRQAL